MHKEDYKIISYYLWENIMWSKESLMLQLGNDFVWKWKIRNIEDISEYWWKLIEKYVIEINNYSQDSFNDFIVELIEYNKREFWINMYHSVFFNTFRYLILSRRLNIKFKSKELDKILYDFCKDVEKNCQREDYKDFVLMWLEAYRWKWVNIYLNIKRIFIK
jgi:hypothetical protein